MSPYEYGYRPPPTHRPPEHWNRPSPRFHYDRYGRRIYDKEGIDARKAIIAAALTVAIGTTAIVGMARNEGFRDFVAGHLPGVGHVQAKEKNPTTAQGWVTATPTREVKTPTAAPTKEKPTPPATSTREPTETPTPEIKPTATPEVLTPVQMSSLGTLYEKDGLPAKLVTQNGQEIKIDSEKMKAAREKAIKTGEIQIIGPLKITTPYTFESSPAHPLNKTLPKDTLSTDELAKKHVYIIQSPKTNLYIRSGAFETGGPLEHLAGRNKNIVIVLVDSNYLSMDALKDTRYDGVRNVAKQRTIDLDTVAIRREKVESFKNAAAKAQERLNELKDKKDADPLEKRATEAGLIQAKAMIFALENGLIKDEDLASQEIASNENLKPVSGLHSSLSFITLPSGEKIPASVIFISVGDKKPQERTGVLYCDASGKCGLADVTSPYRTWDLTPRPSETHPDPSKYERNEKASPSDPSSYPYAGQSAGLTAEHEFAHEITYSNEYETDMLAIQRLTDAWDKWVKSGFKDDSGYPFILSYPDFGGGYIYTFLPGEENSPQKV